MKKLLQAVLLSPLLSCCAVDNRNEDRLRFLSLEECVENREKRTIDSEGKSRHELLFSECVQLQAKTEDQKLMGNRKFREFSKPEDQEYFNERAWSLVIERIRQTHYPQYLSPENEIKRARKLNENQDGLEDKSMQRIFEPRLLPVSPYLMNRRELGMASNVIRELVYENRNNPQLHKSLSSINVIVLNEIGKKEQRH